MSVRTSPFQGLVPFTEDDADWFFGRDKWCSDVGDNLRAYRITVLYGPSGVGKSSVLRAGPLHRLTGVARENAVSSGAPKLLPVVFSNWSLDNPIAALKKAIADVAHAVAPGIAPPADRPLPDVLDAWPELIGGQLLLVLDQFEEFFLYHERLDDSALDEITAALRRRNPLVHFLLSIREDSLAKLDRFKDNVPGALDHLLRIDNLGRSGAEEAIRGPLKLWSEKVAASGETVTPEDALVTAMLDQVTVGKVSFTAADAGTGKAVPEHTIPEGIEAPFLQLVLERLWETESIQWASQPAGTPRLLRLQTLTDLGDAQKIVAHYLDTVLDRLPGAEQDVAGRIFLELVTPSGAKIALKVSDLAAKTQLAAAQVEPLVEHLTGDVRILRNASEGRYEIFHDALSGPILDWSARWQARQRRRRESLQLAALVVLLLVALAFAGLAYVAWHQRNIADKERRQAQSQALAARVPGLLRGRLDDAMLVSLEALGRSDTIEARKAVLTAVQRTDGLVRFLRFAQPVNSLAVARSGMIAVALGGGKLALLDRSGRNVRETLISTKHLNVDAVAFDPVRPLLAAAVTNEVELFRPGRGLHGVYTLKPLGERAITDQDTSSSISFSKDGRWLAAGGRGGLTLWRVDTAGHIRAVPIRGARSNVTALAFDGAQPLLVATVEHGLLAWNLRRPDSMPRPIETGTAAALVFGAHGGAVATRGRVYLWHGPPSARLERLDGVGGSPIALAFNDGNSLLALGDASGRVALWGVKQHHLVGPPLLGQGARIVSIAFEPARSVVAVASADHTVALWDTASRARALRVSEAFGSDVGSAVFGRNGILAAVTKGGTLEVADVDRTPRVRVVTRQGAVYKLAASPDGRRLVVVESSGALAALNSRMEPSQVLRPVYPKYASVANDGSGVAVNGVGGSVQLWDSAGRSLVQLEPPNQRWLSPLPVAISADGRRVAAYYTGPGKIVLWRLTGTADPKGAILDSLYPGTNVNDLAFSPHGTVLALTNDDGTIEIWPVGKPGRPTKLPGGPAGPATIAFAPDGGILASAGVDHTIRLWALQKGLEELGSVTLTGGSVTSVAFSSDGRWLVAVQDGKISLWDVTLWRQMPATLELVRQRFCAVLWSDNATASCH